MKVPANLSGDKLILDYLARVTEAGLRYLPKGARIAFVGQTRARIEKECGKAGLASPDRVKEVLAEMGEPEELVKRERARLDAAWVRRRAGSQAAAAVSEPIARRRINSRWKPATDSTRPLPSVGRGQPGTGGGQPGAVPGQPGAVRWPGRGLGRRGVTRPWRRRDPGQQVPGASGPGAAQEGPGTAQEGPGTAQEGPGTAAGGRAGPGGPGAAVAGPGAAAGGPGTAAGAPTAGGTAAGATTAGGAAAGGTGAAVSGPGTAAGGPGTAGTAAGTAGTAGIGPRTVAVGPGIVAGEAAAGGGPGEQVPGAAGPGQAGPGQGGPGQAGPGAASPAAGSGWPARTSRMWPGERRQPPGGEADAGETGGMQTVGPVPVDALPDALRADPSASELRVAKPAGGPAAGGPVGGQPWPGRTAPGGLPGAGATGRPGGPGSDRAGITVSALVRIARRQPLEAAAVVLLGVGGLILPFPFWPVGVLVAIMSRLWDQRDKWMALLIPVLVVLAGTLVTALIIPGQQNPVMTYTHALRLDVGWLLRPGCLLCAGYLAWRMHQGPRVRVPPWRR